MAPLALSISTGEVILIVVFAAIPVAFIAFVMGAGKALDQIGKGQFAVEFESDLPERITDDSGRVSSESREAEIRQLLEAKAYRRRERGESPLDVEAELKKLMAQGSDVSPGADSKLAEEVRQLVIARNERRLRQGKEPLDVQQEVERQLRDLENLGQ